MPTFAASRDNFTPSTSNDNWTLDYNATAGTFGKVVQFGWGGELTTSTAYNTRWCRPTTKGAGSGTAITLAPHQPNFGSAGGSVYSTYATTQPALPATGASDLWNQAWNAQGGVGVVVLPLANPWWVANGAGQASISCRNIAGTDANGSSYSVVFEE